MPQRLDALNEMEVKAESEAMRKGRTVSKGEYGRKDYLKMNYEDAKEIIKMRLHMTPLPCNYGKSEDGCSLCMTSGKVGTEHYLTCNGTKYLRDKWDIDKDAKIDSNDMEQLRTLSRFLRQVCTLLGEGKETEEC